MSFSTSMITLLPQKYTVLLFEWNAHCYSTFGYDNNYYEKSSEKKTVTRLGFSQKKKTSHDLLKE